MLDGAEEKNKAGKKKKSLGMGRIICTFTHGDSKVLPRKW